LKRSENREGNRMKRAILSMLMVAGLLVSFTARPQAAHASDGWDCFVDLFIKFRGCGAQQLGEG
jgi:hypothetical protein